MSKLAGKQLFLGMLLLLLPLPAVSGEVRVFAAASLTDAVSELGSLYASSHPGATVVRNFAGSGTLAKQIVNGAPADVYLSATPQWMDYLQAEGKVAAENVRVLAYNELVLAGAPNPAVASMADLPRLRRIAIGSPASVPAGRYAEMALRAAGLYEELMDSGKLVIAKDVRQALMYADRGEADGAFVYRTDASLSPRVAVLLTVPKESYPRVTYPMALTAAGTKNPEAEDFFRFLQAPPAREVLFRYGFLLE
jgi:molybdate transport system substrate-binding protein